MWARMSLLAGMGLWASCGPVESFPRIEDSPVSVEPAPVEPLPTEIDPVPVENPPPSSPPPLVTGSTPARRPWLRNSFYAGVAPQGLAVGDFNGDGAPDVAVNAFGRNYSSSYVPRRGAFLLLVNEGEGQLVARPERARVYSSGLISAGDIDGDGHLDALVGTRYGAQVMAGRGDGSFAPGLRPVGSTEGVVSSLGVWKEPSGTPVFWVLGNYYDRTNPGGMAGFSLVRPTGEGSLESSELELSENFPVVRPLDTDHDAAVADFNEDGLLDVVFSSARGSGAQRAQIYLGSTSGYVQPAGLLPTPTTPRWFLRLDTADFNRDGLRSDTLQDYNPEPDDRCPGPGEPLAGDFNGDGLLDIVSSTLGININPTSADGTTLPGEGFVLDSASRFDLQAVDVDGDGRTDLAAPRNPASTELVWFQGDGWGTLRAPLRCTLPATAALLTWADLDADGIGDVAGVMDEGKSLWVALGKRGGALRSPRRHSLGEEIRWIHSVNLLGDERPELVVLLASGQLRVFPPPGP